MRKSDGALLTLFIVASAISMVVLHLLSDRDLIPFDGGPLDTGFIVAISLYNGLALVGVPLMVRYARGERALVGHLGPLVSVFALCAALRVPLAGTWPGPVELAAGVLWETGRVLGVAFAIAYLAHRVYARFFPTTILRARDVTPLLREGRDAGRARRNHCRNASGLFELGPRDYLDTTRLELRTRRELSFSWRDWGEATFWSGMLVLSFTTYAEVYPRLAPAIDGVWVPVITGHLLILIPLLLLPSYPIDKLGLAIPIEGRAYKLADGFRRVAQRWTKLSFIPIFVVALLVKADVFSWEYADLLDALLVCVPATAMVNAVYLSVLRDETVTEIHHGISDWEVREREKWGEEPWHERSLMEGVEPLVAGDDPGGD